MSTVDIIIGLYCVVGFLIGSAMIYMTLVDTSLIADDDKRKEIEFSLEGLRVGMDPFWASVTLTGIACFVIACATFVWPVLIIKDKDETEQ